MKNRNGIQTIIKKINSSITIYGFAPQYYYDEQQREYVKVTTDMAKWSIKREFKNGDDTIFSWADGEQNYNKILDQWDTYDY